MNQTHPTPAHAISDAVIAYNLKLAKETLATVTNLTDVIREATTATAYRLVRDGVDVAHDLDDCVTCTTWTNEAAALVSDRAAQVGVDWSPSDPEQMSVIHTKLRHRLVEAQVKPMRVAEQLGHHDLAAIDSLPLVAYHATLAADEADARADHKQEIIDTLEEQIIDAANEAGQREDDLKAQVENLLRANSELHDRVSTETDAQQVAETRERNTALRTEITRANTVAGLLAAPLTGAVAFTVVTGTISGLPPVARIVAVLAAVLALSVVWLALDVIGPRLAKDGLGLIAQPANAESDAALAEELKTGQQALAAIATRKHLLTRWAKRGTKTAGVIAVLAVIATGLGI